LYEEVICRSNGPKKKTGKGCTQPNPPQVHVSVDRKTKKPPNNGQTQGFGAKTQLKKAKTAAMSSHRWGTQKKKKMGKKRIRGGESRQINRTLGLRKGKKNTQDTTKKPKPSVVLEVRHQFNDGKGTIILSEPHPKATDGKKKKRGHPKRRIPRPKRQNAGTRRDAKKKKRPNRPRWGDQRRPTRQRKENKK